MQTLQVLMQKPWQSAGIFLLIFFLSATFLHLIDFYPEPKAIAAEPERNVEVSVASEVVAAPRQVAAAPVRTAPTSQAVMVEEPIRIVASKVGINTPVVNPRAADITTLDNALLQGAVRYPGSALLGESGTVFLFGHQSGLPTVRNQAFKAFNGLQFLEVGDSIFVESAQYRYEYRVSSVELVLAEDGLIQLSSDKGRLVLSTCNSFGDPGERYVVEALFVARTAR